jgi:lipid A disaccharide synthetase
MKSGTSNLEAAACNTPFAMCYTAPRWAELIIKPLLKIKQYSPVNIVTPGTIREFVSSQLPVEDMAHELVQLVSNRNYINQVRARLAVVIVALTPDERSPAAIVAEMIRPYLVGDSRRAVQNQSPSQSG